MSNDKGTVFFVMGVSGSGKSTVGTLLGKKLGFPFFDGDDYHPEVNILKMSHGKPLNDQDRLPWLKRIRELAMEKGQPGCVIACSALKAKYREILDEVLLHNVHWIFLDGDYQSILDRMKNRKGHFMPEKLLRSQFEALERPEEAFHITVESTPEAQVSEIIRLWKRKSGI